jgi:hypothetical protein
MVIQFLIVQQQYSKLTPKIQVLVVLSAWVYAAPPAVPDQHAQYAPK